jgi:sortase A
VSDSIHALLERLATDDASTAADDVFARARSRGSALRRRRRRAQAAGTLGAVALASVAVIAARPRSSGEHVTATIGRPGPTTSPSLAPRVSLTLHIPSIGLDANVHDGLSPALADAGPGRDPTSGQPGDAAPVVIVGNRTTHGAPFLNLDMLKAGDTIELNVPNAGIYRYRVTSVQVRLPSAVNAIVAPLRHSLVLVTNNPRYSKRQRLVVVASQR